MHFFKNSTNFLSYKGLKQQNICTTFDFRSKIFGLFCTYFDFCFVLCSLIRTFANDHWHDVQV